VNRPIERSRPAWIFLAPFLILFAAFVLYPAVRSVPLAFEQTYGPGVRVPVGARNFVYLVEDPLFWRAVRNTLIYTLGTLVLQLPIAFALALALNARRLKGRAVYRLVFFSPQLMGIVFASILSGLVFEKRFGLVNRVLAGVTGERGLLAVPWLQEHVMATLVIVSIWLYAGFNMVYFLAALQNVDHELVEASEIDGAGPIARLRHVVFPSIRPVATFVVVLSMLGSLQLFELPYVLLDGGGGPNNQGLTVVMYLYHSGFRFGDLGYASAIGWALAVPLITLGLIQMKQLTPERAGS